MLIKIFDLPSTIQKIENQNLCLFYGENLGLMNDLKEEIIKKKNNFKLLKIEQPDIIKNIETFINELLNMSLFEEKKIFFVFQVDDKFIDILQEIEKSIGTNEIYLFSGILNKNSKLRTFFEKSKKYPILPCYPDNELSIKKIITTRLGKSQNLNREVINAIQDASGNDRIKLNNELNKIENCFNEKEIELETVLKLLNTNVNEDLQELTNAALEGNKIKTNKMLSETIIHDDKSIFFLNTLNSRLKRLLDLISLSISTNIDQAISLIKPPIFWKDKQNFIIQAKKLNTDKIKLILKKTYNLELIIKSKTSYNNQILMKKLLIDVCDLANA